MHPTDFEGSNITIGKPKSMTDEQCYPIRAMTGVDEAGFPYIVTAFVPNYDDIKALQEGRPLYLKVIGESFAPLVLFYNR